MIKSCDSHDARVNKLNARFFLSKIPDGNKYMVTAHGLIKQKELPATENGGNGSDGAGQDASQEAATPTSVSDNEGEEDNNNPSDGGNIRDRTSQSASTPIGPTYHEAGRDAANRGSDRGGRGKDGGRCGANHG